jgi:hypothetical protein
LMDLSIYSLRMSALRFVGKRLLGIFSMYLCLCPMFVLLYFLSYISCAILICPPAIGQTTKLMEIVSFKALCLSLVFI